MNYQDANLGQKHQLSIKQQHRQNIGLLFNSASSFDDNAIEVNKSDF